MLIDRPPVKLPANPALSRLASFLQQGNTAYRGGQSSSSAQPGYSPVNSIIPDPVVYGEQSAQALQAYQQALSQIAQRRAGTLQNYGMTAQVDANGNLKNYGIDPSNQYGMIQQLLGQEGSTLDSIQHAATGRGIGHTGLGAQDVSRARFQGGQAQQQLGQQFVGEIGQEASDQYGATANYNAAKLQAQRNAIISAIQSGAFTPVPSSSAGTTPPPMGSQTKMNPLMNKAIANKPFAPKPNYQRTSLARNMGVGL